MKRGIRRTIISFISTHAPAGGATGSEQAHGLRIRKFLLTPLREGRLRAGEAGRSRKGISTHAPAGGATQDDLQPPEQLLEQFLLTPLREGRLPAAAHRR